MSEAAKAARAAMRDKAKRLSGKAPGAVDASGWTEPTDMMPNVKTGARPISKRAFKRGGKVEGHEAMHHAGRKPRKAGGRALSADSLINRNVKEANEERSGPKHIGAFKKGGMVKRKHREGGGDAIADYLATHPAPKTDVPMPPRRPADLPARRAPMPARAGLPSDQGQWPNDLGAGVGYKKGGKVHPDVAEDKALIRKMVKPEARTGKKAGGGNWIAGAVKHPGALHKALHVKEGEKIPAKKLAKAEHSHNPKLAKRARLAETLKGLHKSHGGEAEEISGTRPTGGRTAKFGGGSLGMNPVAAGMASQARPMAPIARKSGGRAGKGKMNVNIVIAGHHPGSAMGNPPAGQPQPPMPPQGQPVPVPMPMGPQGGMMPPGGAPMMPPGGAMAPMARARGGHVYPKMEYGSGGGEGRLEKIEEYGNKMRR